MRKTIAILILITAISSCSDSDTFEDIEDNGGTVVPPPSVTDATYSDNVKTIIDGNCVSCHSSGGAASFRPLTTFTEVKAAVENKDLLGRIQKQTGQSGIMPQGGRMSQSNIDLVVKWSTDGLKEN
jgi:uncharacterized membrane protein